MIINKSIPVFDIANLDVGDIYRIKDIGGDHIVVLKYITEHKITGDERIVCDCDLQFQNYQIEAEGVIESELIYKEVVSV